LSGTTNCAESNLTAEDSKASNTTKVKIGIVPFTEFVNVGTANSTATWMDQTGASSLGNDNFDSDDNDASEYTGAVNRFSLYDKLGVSWAGCVEARKQPYDANDQLPASGDTLFTPEFAPDEPPGYWNDYIADRPAQCTNKDSGAWYEKKVKSNCTQNWSNNTSTSTKNSRYANCTSSPAEAITRTQTAWDGSAVSPAATTQPASLPDQNGNPNYPECTTKYTASGNTGTNSNPRYTLTIETTCNYNFSDRELQERLCKYDKYNNISPTVDADKEGPNQDCPFNDITPLTNTKTTILDAIKEMEPQGYTNIHQGAIWGYHMLSSTAPLTEAQGYDTSTVNVIILMTDGENTVNGYDENNMNKSDGYMAYGYPGAPVSSGVAYNGRIYSTDVPTPASDADVTEAMDDRALLTCTNAKAPVATGEPDKLVIYTIGLNAPNQKTIDLLDDCATDADHSFFPTDPADLTATFKLIADQLSNLRLSK